MVAFLLKRWINCRALSRLGSANLVVEGGRPFLLRRGLKRSALPLLGSANLVHPGLRQNGLSNTASRHRPEAIAVPACCSPRKSQAGHYPPSVERRNKRAWKNY